MKATVIVDSGSTKATWRAFADDVTAFEVNTSGLNPLYLNEKELSEEIDKNLNAYLGFYEIERVYFYGAGCNTPESQMRIQNVLSLFFPESMIHTHSDLEGASIGLFGKNQGIACILGTGSNSCYWNGNAIEHNIPSLGFILGDEGSGAFIGKQVAADFLRKKTPDEITELIQTKYPTDLSFFLKEVYQSNHASRFLASLGGLIGELPNNIYTKRMYHLAFQEFYKKHLIHYKCLDLEFGFIGGIALAMKDIIEEECQKEGLKISKIMHNPIDGIQEYLNKELYIK